MIISAMQAAPFDNLMFLLASLAHHWRHLVVQQHQPADGCRVVLGTTQIVAFNVKRLAS